MEETSNPHWPQQLPGTHSKSLRKPPKGIRTPKWPASRQMVLASLFPWKICGDVPDTHMPTHTHTQGGREGGREGGRRRAKEMESEEFFQLQFNGGISGCPTLHTAPSGGASKPPTPHRKQFAPPVHCVSSRNGTGNQWACTSVITFQQSNVGINTRKMCVLSMLGGGGGLELFDVERPQRLITTEGNQFSSLVTPMARHGAQQSALDE